MPDDISNRVQALLAIGPYWLSVLSGFYCMVNSQLFDVAFSLSAVSNFMDLKISHEMEKISMEIQILNLTDRLEYMDEVSEWFWHEWGGSQTLEQMKYTTLHTSHKDRVPMTFIALHAEKLVGTVSIWRNDLRCRQDLHPWLTNLFVKKEYEESGTDLLLQQQILKTAKELGYQKVFTITTNDQDYYEKSGWTFKEQAPMTNGIVTNIYYKAF